jgi:hypothetical protein
MNIRWMSDRRVNNVRARGFWKTAIYDGVLKFGIGGVLLLTFLGLLWNGSETFAMPWWRRGCIATFSGGFVWGTALWLLAISPLRMRELAHWSLALTILGGGGVYLFWKLDIVTAVTIVGAATAYVLLLIIRENKKV